jgi:hypothetical protein
MSDMVIPVLCNAQNGISRFIEKHYSLTDFNGLFISARQDALNFRHRMSQPGYFSDWHVAGDPTLIIIRAGVLRIGLRDQGFYDFAAGDMFIAQDKLPDNIEFDRQMHGHTAALVGDQGLLAVHLKLASLAD